MNNNCNKICRYAGGFSLAEVLAALTIGSLILVAVLGIYNRAERSAEAIRRRVEAVSMPSEVLQRIAEDIDRTTSSGSDVKVTIENKMESHGYSSAKMTLSRYYYGKKDKQETFEEIIWQSYYDYDTDVNGMVLYRSHSGIAVEDKLLDEDRDSWESLYPFVPMCNGVSLFKIQVPDGNDFLDTWKKDSLPVGVVVSVSFAEPFKAISGEWEVYDDEKHVRTIALNRTKNMAFTIDEIEYDVNDLDDINDVNDANSVGDAKDTDPNKAKD